MEPLVFKTKFDKVTWRFWRFAFTTGGMSSTGTGEDIGIAIVEVIVITKEVVNDELLFLDMFCCACSASPHLLVKDGTAHPTAHNQVENFTTVESSV